MKKKWLWTGIAVACFAATVAVGCGGVNWRDDPGEETTEYEVVFMNGEEEFWSVSVAEGDPVPQPEGTPEKAADDAYTYTFAGWSLEEEGEVTSLATAVSEDMTYYAVFTPESKETVYTVTFVDGVTGEAIDVQRVPLGGDAALPQAPVHEGFTFTGWEGDHTDIDRRTDIVAQYSRNSYTLTLGALGGTSTQEVLFEGALAPEAPEVPQGLLFEGWFVEEEGTEPVLLTEKYPNGMPAADVSATAHFAVDFSGVKLTATDVPVYGDSVALQLPSYEGMSYSYEWSDGSTEAQFPWKGAGSQTASVTVSARYENAAGAVVTGEKTLTSSADVVKATLTVTLSAEDVTYGQAPAPEASFQGFVLGESEEVLGGALTYLFNGSAEAPVHAGNYALSASGLTSENYSIEYKGAGFSIQKAALNVTVTLKSDTLVYGTQPQAELAFAGLVAGDEALKASFAVSYTLNGNEADASRLTVGTYSVAAKASQQLTDYAVTAPSVQLTVERKPITLAVTVGNITYGETPAPQVSSDGFVYGEDMSELTGGYFTYFKGGEAVSGRLSAGTYMVKTGGYTARNYTVTDGEAQFTVNKKEITVTVSASQSSYPYTTQASAIAGSIRPDGLIPGETSSVLSVGGYELQKDGKPVTGMPDAGSYTLTASVTAENYAVTVEAGSVTIAPLAVIVSASGRQDALTEWSTDAFTTTLPAGFAFSGTLSLNEEDAGTYTDVAADFTWTQPYAISYQGEPVKAENFAFTFDVSVTLDLLTFKVDASQFAFSAPYTGGEIALGSGIVLAGYEDFKAEYRMDGGTYSASLPTGVNARNYTVGFRLSAKNYKAYEGSYTAVITQAENAIEVSTVTGYTYNGEAQTVAFEEFVSAKFGTVVLKEAGSNVFTAAGTHTFEVQVVATNNYMGATEAVTVEFARAPLTVSLSGSSTYTALSADMVPTLSAKMLGDDKIDDLHVTGVVFKQNGEVKSGMLPAGDYTVTAEVTDPSGNYIVEVQAGTFTVAKRAITVSVTGSGPAETKWSTQTFTAEGLQGFTFAGKLVLPAAEADAKTYDAIDSFEWETPLSVTYGSDDVTENFIITYDVSVTINFLTFSVPDVTPEPLTYNTAAQGLTAKFDLNGLDNVTVTYSREENGTYTKSVPTGTNADTYTVWYKLSRKNYNDYTGSYTVTIAKAGNDITEKAPLSVTYNGFEQTLDLADYFKATDGEITGTFTVKEVREEGYSITVSVEATKNYNAAEETFTFTVKQAEIKAEIQLNESYTYAEKMGLQLSAVLLGGDKTDVLEVDYTYWQGEKQVTDAYLPVGEYTVKAEVTAKNYIVTVTEGNFSVTPRTLTITATDTDAPAGTHWTADKNTLGNDLPEGFVFAEGVLTLNALDYREAPYVAMNSAIGEFEWTTQPKITLNGADVTGNFALRYNVQVTLNALKFEDSDFTKPSGSAGTYTGEEISLGEITGTQDRDITVTYRVGEEGEFTETLPMGTNAGEYTVYFKVNAQYYAEYEGRFTVSIAKAANEINLKEDGALDEFVYDGTERTLNAAEYFMATDGTVTGSVTIKDAQQYTFTVNVAATGNYEAASKNFEFTVGKKAITVHIVTNDTYTYGEPVAPTLDAVLCGSDTVGLFAPEYSYTKDDASAAQSPYFSVGSYTVTATIKDTKNYHIDSVTPAEFTVERYTVTISASATQNAGTQWEMSSFTDVTLPAGVTLTGTLALAITADGSYTAKGSSLDDTSFEWRNAAKFTLNDTDVTENFAFNYNLSVTLEAFVFDVFINNNLNQDYTGKPISLAGGVTLNGEEPEGFKIEYLVDGEYMETAPTATEAGEYPVSFRLTATNYAEQTGSYTFTINQAENNIRPTGSDTITVTYNGYEQAIDFADRFKADFGEVELETPGSNVFKDAGDQYEFVICVAGTKNYAGAVYTVHVKVEQAELTVTVVASDSYTYADEIEPTIRPSGFVGNDNESLLSVPKYTFTKVGGGVVADKYLPVGDYTVTADVTAGNNYKVIVKEASFTVTARTVNVTVTGEGVAEAEFSTGEFTETKLPAEFTLTGGMLTAEKPDAGTYSYKELTAAGFNLKDPSVMLGEADVTDNFTFEYTVNVTITYLDFEDVLADKDFSFTQVYNGSAITLGNGIVLEDIKGFGVTYGEAKGSYTQDIPEKTDAGKYTVYFKLTGRNYHDYEGSYNAEITQAPNKITPTDTPLANYTYNGYDQTVAFAEQFTADFGTIVLMAENGNVFKNAGEHTFTIGVLETDNWAEATYQVTVNFAKAQITVTLEAEDVAYAEDTTPGMTATLLGEDAGKDAAEVLGANGTIKYSYTAADSQAMRMRRAAPALLAENGAPLTVGSYTVDAEITAQNYVVTDVKEDTFKVTPRTVTVTVTGSGFAESTWTQAVTGANTDLPEGFTFAGTLSLAQMDVGTYKANGDLASGFEWQDDWQISYNGAEVAAENFDLTYDLSVKLTPLSFDGKVTVGDPPELTYTGSAQSLKAEISVSVEGSTVQYSLTNNGSDWKDDVTETDANEDGYTVYFKVSRTNYTDYTGSYIVTIAKAGNDITAIEGKELSVTYSGKEWELDLTDFLQANEGAALSYTCTETIRNAGSYTLTVTAAETDNYKAAEKTFTFTVTPAPLTVTLAQENVEYTTLASAISPKISEISGLVGADIGNKSLVKLGAITITPNDTAVNGVLNAGDYTVTAVVTAGDNYKVTVNAAKFAVNKKQITVSYTGDGMAEEDWQRTSGFTFDIAEEYLVQGTLALENTDWGEHTAKGTYLGDFTWTNVSVKFAGEYVTQNFTFAFDLSVTLERRTDWDYPQVGAYDAGEYTGKEIALGSGITYENPPKGFEVHYRLGESGTWQTTVPTAINADEYTVYYYFTATNYVDSAVNSYQATIQKASGNDITETEVHITYTGETLTLEDAAAQFTAKYGTVTLAWNGDEQTICNANTYYFTASVADEGNYAGITGVSVTLVIDQAEYTIAQIPEGYRSFTAYIEPGMTLSYFTFGDMPIAWENPDTALDAAGTAKHWAVYTSQDPNYKNFRYEVSITLNKQRVELTVTPSAAWSVGFEVTSFNAADYNFLAAVKAVGADNTPFTGLTMEQMVTFDTSAVTEHLHKLGGTWPVRYSVIENKYYDLVFVGADEDGNFYAPFKITSVDYSGTQYTIEDALKAAASGVIVVAHDSSFADPKVQYAYTGDAAYYTVRSGVTLLVPYSQANSEAKKTEFESAATVTAVANKGYALLILTANTNMIVKGNITVNALVTQTSPYSSIVIGANYGAIEIQNNATLIFESGAALENRGFIYGEGNMIAEDGAKIYELFNMLGYKGGTVSLPLTIYMFPMNQYGLSGIIVNTEFRVGSTYGARAYITATLFTTNYYSATVDFISSNDSAFMQLKNGSVFKKIDEESGKIQFNICGDVNFNNLSVELGGLYGLSTKGKEVPIPGNFAITISSGTTVISDDVAMKLLPGASVVTLPGTTVDLNGKLYVYSNMNVVSFSDGATAWKDGSTGYPVSGNKVENSYRVKPTLGYTATTAAVFRVAGMLNINAGATFGGEITGDGVAQIKVASDVSLSDSIKENTSGSSTNNANFTAKLSIGGTLTNMEAGKTYTYTNGTWA